MNCEVVYDFKKLYLKLLFHAFDVRMESSLLDFLSIMANNLVMFIIQD